MQDSRISRLQKPCSRKESPARSRSQLAPGGRTLTDSVTQGAKHIITTKLDRLFRDCEDALNMSRQWDRAGVALHVLDMGGQAIDTSTAIGRMFLTMTAGVCGVRTQSDFGAHHHGDAAQEATPPGLFADSIRVRTFGSSA